MIVLSTGCVFYQLLNYESGALQKFRR